MKKILIAGIAAVGLLLSTAAQCSVVPRPSGAHVHSLAPTPVSISPDGQRMVDLVNEQRVAAGCEALVVNGTMTAFAQNHTRWMADGGGLTHSQLGGTIQAENIAAGIDTADEVVDAWMDSEPHKANIIDCSYTHTGAAKTGSYWAQVYGVVG